MTANPDTRDPVPQAASGADALPRHTTPTWEVELLISGVAVFAMLQLSGWLSDQLLALAPRFGEQMAAPLTIMYVYTESAAVILATTFALHLLLRARWIALVGMHSVYPDGIRWDKLRLGPVQLALDRKRLDSPDALIDRADNRATIVFATGVQMASTLLLISVMVGSTFAATLLLSHVLGWYPDPGRVFMYCAYALILPFVLAPLVDRRFGARMREGGPGRRLLALVLRAMSAIGLSRNSSVVALASSQLGRRRYNLAIILVILAVATSVLFSVKTMRVPERLGSYSLFPDAGQLPGRSLDDAHYDDRRDPLRDRPVPYVQSAVVIGPYLRLTVPFEPGRDDRAQHALCAKATALPAGEKRAGALLDCLQALRAVSLDGKPLPGLRYVLASDPRSDRPALLAMIDVRALARGRHELAVARPAAHAGAKADRERIVFWR